MSLLEAYLSIAFIIFLSPFLSRRVFWYFGNLDHPMEMLGVALFTICWPVVLVIVAPWKLFQKVANLIWNRRRYR